MGGMGGGGGGGEEGRRMVVKDFGYEVQTGR